MKQVLLYFSPVAVPDPNANALALPRKFLDGMYAFAELWRGAITLLVPRAMRRDDNLDYVTVARATLPFQIDAFPTDAAALRKYVESATLVYVPLVPQFIHTREFCIQANVPIVYDADYTLAIRQEIVRAETRNPVLRWRRLRWAEQIEARYQEMMCTAAGAQFQGLPAYEAYAPLNRSPLLYFDSRVTREMLATQEQLEARSQRLQADKLLRLVYSGRWIPIKGVLDLPRLAVALRQAGVSFELDIFGGGALEADLRRAFADTGSENVRLRGELPFSELMAFAAKECDLFVCCHKQGDPSASFIEMLSLGVPLIGYDHSGLRGLVNLSGAGWLTPRNDVNALAKAIAALAPDALVTASRAAVAFTRDKDFQTVMEMRVAHLNAVAAGETLPAHAPKGNTA